MKQLKIVQAIFTGGFAGSERIVAELCNGLSERHDVLLLMSTDSPLDGKSILTYVNDRVRYKRIPGFLRPLRVAFETWKFGANIYHGHLGRAVRYAKYILSPTKRIATWHMGRPITVTKLDGITLVSKWQNALSRKGRGSPKFAVVPNWVSRFETPATDRIESLKDEAGIRDYKFVLGFVGRAPKRKKLQEALEAFSEWNPQDVAFVVVGVEAPEISGGAYAADPRIRFLGHREAVFDYYSIMDCVVFPATNEAFGLVAIEAMRAGRRLILHNSHGLKDIASENPDIISIDADEPGQLRQAYIEAFNRRNESPNYDMSLYEPEARIRDIEKLYADLLEPTGDSS